jgi:predicted Zn-dependent protease
MRCIRHGLSVSLVLMMALAPAFAGAARAGAIRDAETEALIRDYARPIFKAAGLTSQNVQIHIIGDGSFNAFVSDGQNMWIHTGAIVNSKTPNQLIGVIAHESGHITGGHLARLKSQMKNAQGASLMTLLAGVGIMAAGAATKSDISSAGGAVLLGGQSLVGRSVLAYRRTEESSADSAAVSFLDATGQSGKGMLETFEYFVSQGIASMRSADPYLQSHPMPAERISQLRDLVKRSRYFDRQDSPEMQLRHDMVKAKLVGFIDDPASVFNTYPRSDSRLPARYARAIATYRQSGLQPFLPQIDQLISERPDNAYFYEVKGQFLFEGGKVREAVAPLRKAVSLAPDEPLIRILLAQALLASSDDLLVDEAIRQLRKAKVKEDHNPSVYRQMADAYGKKQQTAEALLASAQAYFYEGRVDDAKQLAGRAKGQFKQGSPEWLKADDLVKYQPQPYEGQ